MPAPLVTAAAITAGGSLLSGLFGGGGGIGKKEIAMILRTQREQEMRRAKEFASGVGDIENLTGEFGDLSSRFLGSGGGTLDQYSSYLDQIEGDIGSRLEERIKGIQGETSTLLNQTLQESLPAAFRAGGRAGFSPFGGRTARAVGATTSQALQRSSEFANARLQQAMFDVIPAQLNLAQQRGALGQFQTELGVGLKGSEASLREALFGARINTPYASEAIAARDRAGTPGGDKENALRNVIGQYFGPRF